MNMHSWKNGSRNGSITIPKIFYLDEKNIILIEDWKPEYNLNIPKGFVSDLGSIPEVFWWIVTPEDIKFSSIMHDYRYTLCDYNLFTYKEANLEFLKNCCDWDAIPNWKALFCFMGVEIFRTIVQTKRWILGNKNGGVFASIEEFDYIRLIHLLPYIIDK